jgi:hypothetical protein
MRPHVNRTVGVGNNFTQADGSFLELHNSITELPEFELPTDNITGVGNSQIGCTKIRDSREILEIPKDSMIGEIGRFWPGRTRVYEDSGELPTPEVSGARPLRYYKQQPSPYSI